ARHSQLLECRLQSSLYCGGSCRTARILSPARDPCVVPRDIPDRLWLVLLSLGSERPHAVLGPAAYDALLHGDPCGRHRGARECKIGSSSALAAARNRPAEPVGVALDRRSAALRLGTVLSHGCRAVAASDVHTRTFRHVLLGCCRGALCARQAVRVL